MLQQDQNMHMNKREEESVEELLQKLAKKGKKVKLLDESASVKELPTHQEQSDDDGEDINQRGDIDVDAPEDVTPTKSAVKRKMNKIKEDRENDMEA
jgi:hypothetical protein